MACRRIYGILYLIGLFMAAGGCRPDSVSDKAGPDRTGVGATACTYGPRRIDIMPITEYVHGGEEKPSRIKAYVSLKDAFGCSLKAPTVFRFELYEYVRLASDQRGRRLAVWPDSDLLDAGANNDKWQDFLRGYEFELPCDLEEGRRYLLQVTCLCPEDRRLTDESVLEVPGESH